MIPVCSFREPTLYQTWKLTTGAECTSLVSTFSPQWSIISVSCGWVSAIQRNFSRNTPACSDTGTPAFSAAGQIQS